MEIQGGCTIHLTQPTESLHGYLNTTLDLFCF